MVDAVTAVGTASMVAAGLMVLGMLYLTFLGIRDERRRVDAKPAANENE